MSVLGNDERVAHWRAFEAEQRDLEDLDYPFFWALTDGTTLHDSRGTEVGTFSSISAYDQVVNRLTRLDANDREHQESLIRFIYAYTVGPIATLASASSRAVDSNVPIDAPTALAEARAIAGALEALVLRDRDGSAQWVGIDREQSTAGLVLRRLPDRFVRRTRGDRTLSGGVGFRRRHRPFGACTRSARAAPTYAPRSTSTRRSDAADRNRRGIRDRRICLCVHTDRASPQRRELDRRRASCRARHYTRRNRLRHGPRNTRRRCRCCHGTPVALRADRGTVASRTAKACGLHLLGAATEEPVTHRRAWRLKSDTFATGFAHGAGGIAAALLRLATATGDERFAAAAAHGFGSKIPFRIRHSPARRISRPNPRRQTSPRPGGRRGATVQSVLRSVERSMALTHQRRSSPNRAT